ncbi:hypothetical protein JTB14_013595 [Gonioctena quinquepunctata]|nr:hypothetical protein JTB14_013595 [Gonioctena quinquepunctata]
MTNKVTHRAEIENPTLNQTQCESCKAEQHKQRRRPILTKVDSYDCFKLATEENWRDEILPKIVAHIINRLRVKEDLLKQNKKEREVAMMAHSLGWAAALTTKPS